jgi:hypothetical protein
VPGEKRVVRPSGLELKPFGEHCLLLTTLVVVATPGTGAVYSIDGACPRLQS